jgi:BirA family biotin operon repressor/biotin-[acetyl-CoA-carboxylase] ligase
MPIGTPFIELQSVDSTNNYALARIHEGMAHHGTCFFAHEQTAGKGQMGKLWTAGNGSDILLSIVLQPSFLQSFQQFWLSAAVAVATHQFFYSHAGEETKIKWPNDLYWQNRKAGGILIENIIGPIASEKFIPASSSASNHGSTKWKWAVAGIGININETKFPAHLLNPVSLKQVTGKDHDVPRLAKELCGSMDTIYKKLMIDGVDPILERYNEFLYKKNERVKLKQGSRVFETTIKAVSESGQLITQHAIEERFNFGEIEWL